MTAKTALITGATRGIGHETALQLAEYGLHVWVTGRDEVACLHTVNKIVGAGGSAGAQVLDVTDSESVARCVETVGRVDVLINNAGIFPDPGISLFQVEEKSIRESMAVNFYGPLRLCRALVPGMLKRDFGRIVNLTSGYAQLNGMTAELAAYKTAKAAANALTCVLAAEVAGDVKVNAVDPGWVRTDMGGEQAPRSAADAAADVVHAATLPYDGPNGRLLRYRQIRSW